MWAQALLGKRSDTFARTDSSPSTIPRQHCAKPASRRMISRRDARSCQRSCTRRNDSPGMLHGLARVGRESSSVSALRRGCRARGRDGLAHASKQRSTRDEHGFIPETLFRAVECAEGRFFAPADGGGYASRAHLYAFFGTGRRACYGNARRAQVSLERT